MSCRPTAIILANYLDVSGLTKEADEIDSFLKKTSDLEDIEFKKLFDSFIDRKKQQKSDAYLGGLVDFGHMPNQLEAQKHLFYDKFNIASFLSRTMRCFSKSLDASYEDFKKCLDKNSPFEVKNKDVIMIYELLLGRYATIAPEKFEIIADIIEEAYKEK